MPTKASPATKAVPAADAKAEALADELVAVDKQLKADQRLVEKGIARRVVIVKRLREKHGWSLRKIGDRLKISGQGVNNLLYRNKNRKS